MVAMAVIAVAYRRSRDHHLKSGKSSKSDHQAIVMRYHDFRLLRRKWKKQQGSWITLTSDGKPEASSRSGSMLPLSFFERSAAKVARGLIGKKLVRLRGRALVALAIVETEAYEGVHDLASHSSKGRTKRTEVMFGPAGRFYVYRIYGLHWMLNVVTGDVGDAAAVLIRGVEGISGPGRVASALGIDAALHGLKAVPQSGLWFEDEQTPSRKVRISATPRIGVDYAGPIWAAKKLRFVLG